MGTVDFPLCGIIMFFHSHCTCTVVYTSDDAVPHDDTVLLSLRGMCTLLINIPVW